jgi:hypothetical protein
LTSEAAAVEHPTSPIRANIARFFFQLLIAPLRMSWRVLPKKHPARIYLDGREEAIEGVDEALTCRGFYAMKIIACLALVSFGFGIETIVDAMNANPISKFFGL